MNETNQRVEKNKIGERTLNGAARARSKTRSPIRKKINERARSRTRENSPICKKDDEKTDIARPVRGSGKNREISHYKKFLCSKELMDDLVDGVNEL